jgi:outer membrane lipoprotein-sorting protein
MFRHPGDKGAQGITMIRRTINAFAGAAAAALLCSAAANGAETKAPAPNAVGTGQNWNANVAADAAGSTLDEKQTAMIKQVNGYFNALTSLKGSFRQAGGDGKKMHGKFFMRRPGKFRFEYGPPSKQLIVSDGEYLAVQDLDLNNEDRIALDQTAFRLLLRKEVDLLRDARILDAQMADDLIVLSIQDKSPDTPGRIKLFMTTKPVVELKEWVTLDAQGLETRVEVSDLIKGEALNDDLFKIKPVGLTRNQ